MSILTKSKIGFQQLLKLNAPGINIFTVGVKKYFVDTVDGVRVDDISFEELRKYKDDQINVRISYDETITQADNNLFFRGKAMSGSIVTKELTICFFNMKVTRIVPYQYIDIASGITQCTKTCQS